MDRLTPKDWKNPDNYIWKHLGLLKMCDEVFRSFLSRSLRTLAHYEDLAEQGRLVVLPCAVGDTVWILDKDGQPRKMILDEPDIRCHCAKEENLCMALCDRKNTGICAYRLKNDGSSLGKTVFLTREEAETKLAEGGSNRG